MKINGKFSWPSGVWSVNDNNRDPRKSDCVMRISYIAGSMMIILLILILMFYYY